MTEPIGDTELEARLESHFGSLACVHPVPDFDAQMALAAERTQPRHRRRVGAYGVAAGVVAIAAGVALLVSVYEEPLVLDAADQRLVIELTASTTWRAPSDGWLEAKGLEILSMPRFDDMTYKNGLKRSAVGGV